MVEQLLARVFHVKEVCLHELKQISVLETRGHFNFFILSKPIFNICDSSKFVFSYIVPSEKHCSFIVISLYVYQVEFLGFNFVSQQWRHVVSVLFAVKRVAGIRLARLLG